MATLYLICGPPGSGKTTLAQELEQRPNTLRLSEPPTAEESVARLVIDGASGSLKLTSRKRRHGFC